jgi:NTE family protein
VVAAASLGVFMAFVDSTVVGIAFPNIVRSFHHASVSGLTWVLNGYNIAFAALLVPAGRFADRYGRRLMYVVGTLVFTLASALSASAPSLGGLIGARVLQGVGAALLIPASLAMVLHGVPPRYRAQSVAAWAATAALAAGIGPTVGGVLVDAYNWRLVFIVNLPVGVLVWWLSRTRLVESRAPGERIPPDLNGALLIATAAAGLTLAISEGPDWGWASAGVIISAVVAFVAGLAVVQRVRSHPAPVIDLELLRTRGFRVISGLTAVGATGFYSLGLANVLFLIEVWHYSPLVTGLAITPAPFVTALAAVGAGRLAPRFDARAMVALGALMWAAGPLILLARMGSHPDYLGAFLPGAAVAAIGVGIGFPLVSDAAVASAPRGHYALASAFNNATRQLGAAIGIAILAAIVGSTVRSGALHTYRDVWVFAACCFGLVALGAAALPPFHAPELDSEEEEFARRRAELAASAPPRKAPPCRNAADPVARAVESDEELLAEVALFAALPEDIRKRLAKSCRTVRLAGGEWLFRQGDVADAMYIVRAGRLEVLFEPDGGRPERLHELGRGSAVGELALLSANPRSASIRARRDAVLLRVDRASFESMLSDGGEFATAIARALGGQLQHARRLDAEVRTKATTVAVVRSPNDQRGAAFESALMSALHELSYVAHLGRSAVGEATPEDELGPALTEMLDRAEREHDLVILTAAAAPRDPWLESCLRQADRVLLVVDQNASTWAGPETHGLNGCDVVLTAPAGEPGTQELMAAIEPGAVHRVREVEDVRRLARRLSGRAVGLVLSGGGARALAHIGVVEELLAAGITIDRIGGASMGAFLGALLAQGMDADEIDAVCYQEFVRRNPIGDYTIPRTSLIRGRRAEAMLRRNLSGLIEDLPLPYYCVSTDILAAEQVVHRRGDLVAAVAASMCLPGLAPPVSIGDRLLVDGSVLDNLPVGAMAAQFEGPIISSDVTEPEEPASDEPVGRIGLVDTLARVMVMSNARTHDEGPARSSLYITPNHECVGRLEFHMLDRMREAGRRAALAALEQAPPEIFG